MGNLDGNVALISGTGRGMGRAAGHGPGRGARLPAPARLPGYAFVELAVDGLLEHAAERMLHALGFARRGRHRTKPVEPWRHGDACLLVSRGRPARGPGADSRAARSSGIMASWSAAASRDI